MTVYVLIEAMNEERDVRGVYSTEAAAQAAIEICKVEDPRFGYSYGIEPHVLDAAPEPF